MQVINKSTKTPGLVMGKLALVVSAIVVLNGCAKNRHPRVEIPNFAELKRKAFVAHEKMSRVTNAQAKKHYSDFTVKTWGPSHGTQVEYFKPNGRCFLWYPGNAGINPCRWKIERQVDKSSWVKSSKLTVPHICFSYGNNSYNPVTKHRGSSWQCKRALSSITDAKGNITFILPAPGMSPASANKIAGDPFKLSSRNKVPFVLVKKKYSFEELRRGL